jgi:septum formation protein
VIPAREVRKAVEKDDGSPLLGAMFVAYQAAMLELDAPHVDESVYVFSRMALLVLASTSKYRAALLSRVGLEFERAAPSVDERAVKRSGLPPREVAETLARMKAEDVAERAPGAYVVGGDQLVEFEGEILDKPGSFEHAAEQLERLAGAEHRLITAIALRHPSGHLETAVDVHALRMRRLGRGEIERVIRADEPYDCAGSYKIERRGILLFDSIVGEDFSAIEGIPLMALGRLLRAAGFTLP